MESNEQKNTNPSINEQMQPTVEPSNIVHETPQSQQQQPQPQPITTEPLPQQTVAQTNISATTAPTPTPTPAPAPTQIQTSAPAKKSNIKLIIIIILVAILTIGGIVAGLFLGGVIKLGDASPVGDSPTPISTDTSPTPELAKSVCEKHGGKYTIEEDSSSDYSIVYYCEKSSDGNSTFEYKITFLDDDKIEENRNFIKAYYTNLNANILEDSDSFLKILISPSEEYFLDAYLLIAIYENALIELETIDGPFGEDLLAELGFPDRNRNENYITIETQEIKGINDSRSDGQYRDALAKVSTLITYYQTNNNGQLPTISNSNLIGFDSYLENSDLNYSVVGFDSFAESEFATDETGLYSIPSDQIYIFYKTDCQNNSLLSSDSTRSYTVVHSNSSNDGYFCVGSR